MDRHADAGLVQEEVRSADGTSIAYWRGGSGRPLVLLTGALMDHGGWERLLPLLTPHAEVVALDRRGRGASGDTPPYSVEREVEDLFALQQAIGGPVDLLGHSSGAVLALRAAQAGLPLRRLALYEPPIWRFDDAAEPPIEMSSELLDLVAAGKHEAAVLTFVRQGLDPSAMLESLRARPYWAGQVAMAPTIPYDIAIVSGYRWDSRSLASLAVPTLLLYGESSPPYMKAAVDALAAALPSSRIAMLQGQGHIAMYTAPQLLARELIDFFSKD